MLPENEVLVSPREGSPGPARWVTNKGEQAVGKEDTPSTLGVGRPGPGQPCRRTRGLGCYSKAGTRYSRSRGDVTGFPRAGPRPVLPWAVGRPCSHLALVGTVLAAQGGDVPCCCS